MAQIQDWQVCEMRNLVRPRVLLPLLLSVSLLAALLMFADVHAVFAAIARFRPAYLAIFLALMAAYEGVRCVQWQLLLRSLGIRTSTRTSAFTFLVGEMAKTLPMGQYLRNYLLRQTGGTNLGQSAPATLVTLLIEDAVALVGVLVLGIGAWNWLRPLILVSALLFGAAIFVVYRLIISARMPKRIARARRFRAILGELRLFKTSTALLANPRTLPAQVACGAAYLVLGATALYFLLLGLGVSGVSFPQALAVYFFSLACGLLIPIPVDIGLIELSGTTALLAVGVSRSAAVSAMLLNRVLGGAAAVLIALVTMAVLHRELRAALGSRAPSVAEPAQPLPEPAHHVRAPRQPSLAHARQVAPISRPLGEAAKSATVVTRPRLS
ncbi:MAG: flippase-like domain-containing protein [Ktedonobacterales bacterium]|nr:flippase-like domain-containing protein [Ktedonobacterales bacterium]